VSLQPTLAPPVPDLTARATFPKGNPYLRLRDELGTVLRDADSITVASRRNCMKRLFGRS
jgi:transposase